MQLQVGDRLSEANGEWEVIGRPYTTNAGKDAHVRVRRIGQPDVTEIRDLARARARQREANDCRGGQAMMRVGQKAVLPVVLYLLASATTVYAECAWVLWRQTFVTVSITALGVLDVHVLDSSHRARPRSS
jgi:hypothetical protein